MKKIIIIGAFFVLLLSISLYYFSPKQLPVNNNIAKVAPEPKKAETFKIIKPLSIKENNIVDKNGQIVQLIGVTTDEFRYHNVYKTIDELKQRLLLFKKFGVNLVVLYLEQPNKVKARQQEIVELVNWADSNDIFVLLYPVVHQADNAKIKFNPFDKNLNNILGSLSSDLKNYDNVLYGTGAEPHDVSPEKLFAKQTELIKTIRDSSPNAIIVINGLVWGHQLDYYLENPIDAPNILYDVHKYTSPNKNNVNYDFCQVPKQYSGKLPLFLGEFGGVHGQDFGSDEDLKCYSLFFDSIIQHNQSFSMYSLDSTTDLSILGSNNQLTKKGQVFVDALTIIKNK